MMRTSHAPRVETVTAQARQLTEPTLREGGQEHQGPEPSGYYQGSVYHGAIQFLLDPTGHRMRGQWVSYGRDFDLNTGPWTLELVSSDTSIEAIERFNRQPESANTAPDTSAG